MSDNVYQKLMRVQSKLKAPKNQFNKFGNYSYRSCEDILEGLKPLLKEVGAILVINDEVVNIANRFYIKATASFISIDDGEKIISSELAREEEERVKFDLAQLTGSVSSYARKYALNGLFAIDDTKDSDSTNKHDKDNITSLNNENKWTNPKLTDNQIKRLYAIAHSKGVVAEKVKSQVEKQLNKKVEELTKAEYDKVCEAYENIKVANS
ncbi:ERF family protein [Terrisporobacter mayombei]|uniref:ERF family protein n=1 Tax=Terrisporobacter mayombei TaxID=1541 RepID=UPI0026592B78|nr:ERF family protein [Terrisporobacter mayombei]MCC3668643.1 ERF family protein [Terrisporobacter mayombei]